MAAIKTGDSGTQLAAVLTDSEGNPADISGADIRVLMRRRGDGFLIEGEAVNAQTSPETFGNVYYIWQESDTVTDNVGLYRVEWEVTFELGEVQTYPSNGWNYVAIVRDNDEEAS